MSAGLPLQYKSDMDALGRLAAQLKRLAGQDLTANPVWREFANRFWTFYRR